MFTGIIYSIFYWIDSLTIGYFMGAADVGLYNAAFPVVALLGIFPEIFMQLFFPLITREYANKKFGIIKDLSQQVGKWIFVLNLPLFLIMLLFPGEIIGTLFGAEYIEAGNALKILSIGGIFSSIVLLCSNLLLMIKKSKLFMINLLITSVTNFILNFILVPIYGINGAAFATAIVWIGLSLILLLEIKHYIKIIPIKRKLLRVLIVTLLSLLIFVFFRHFYEINTVNIAIPALGIIAIYISLIFTTGCLDKNDITILKSIKKKLLKSVLPKVKVNG